MRLLVTGPRAFKEQHMLYCALDALKPTEVIHGGAEGADTFAGSWARFNGVRETERSYPEHLGKAGGVLRNQYMLDTFNPDMVLACSTDGLDKGTNDCVTRALKMGIPVVRLVCVI